MKTPSLAVAILLVARLAVAQPLVSAVDAVGMTVSDMDRAVAFYTTVLDFAPLSDVEVAAESYARLAGVTGARVRIVRLRLGDEAIELVEYRTPRGRPLPPDSRSNDRWFQHVAIVVSDMDRAYARLRQHRVEHASSAPQTLPAWNPQAAGIRAFYFKDPDAHVLELLQFPPDKGAAKWRAASERLFLGIDHTAIVVADTDASLRFYRSALGFAVAGESLNHGPEQEQLNDVRGARLRITALRGGAGPGIELLEYLAPGGGRPIAPDQRANDVGHWQTRLVAADAAKSAEVLRERGVAFVSPGVVDIPDDALGFDLSLLVRDPDGHAVEVVQP